MNKYEALAKKIIDPFYITMYPPNVNKALSPQLELEIYISAALKEMERETIERCAKAADKRADLFNGNETPDFRDGSYLASREIACLLRTLKTEAK